MAEERKFYLTLQGLEKIKKEYKILESLRSAKTEGDVPGIWESEDLNPEYLSFQEDLELLEARLTEIGNILKNIEIIKTPSKEKQNIVGLGAKVLVEVNGKNNAEFAILGSIEADPTSGKISNESPVGSVLMGHKVGDQVIVSLPVKTTYKIKKIEYG